MAQPESSRAENERAGPEYSSATNKKSSHSSYVIENTKALYGAKRRIDTRGLLF
jgi:hypothetical protein